MPLGRSLRLVLVPPAAPLAFAALVTVAFAGCHEEKRSAQRSEPAASAAAQRSLSAPAPPLDESATDRGPPALRGSLPAEVRSIGLAVYAPQPIDPRLLKDTQEAARQRFPGVNVLFMPMTAPLPQALIFAPDIASFAPPSEEQLTFFGRGLDPAQRHAAAMSKGVLVLGWKLDADPTLDRLRDAQRLAFEVAQKTGGTVWDETTGQLFGVAAWKRMRLDGWEGNVPDMRQFISLRYQAYGDQHRAVTVGMVKFGLPDLVIADVSPSDAERMATLVEVVAQLLVEGQTPGTSGALSVSLKDIHHKAARTALTAAMGKDAQPSGRVELVPTQAGSARPGDPENRLVTLRFPYPGTTDAEKAAAALAAILGTPG